MKYIKEIAERKKLSAETKKIIEKALKLIEQDNIKSVHISLFFEYVQKAEEKLWDNKNRSYYLHNVPLEGISNDPQVRDNIARCNAPSVEKKTITNERLRSCIKELDICTAVQRRRYLLKHYYGLSINRIAQIESVSTYAVKSSLRSVDRKLSRY